MSAKLREMLDKRNTLITQARALLDKAEAEHRNLSTEGKTQYDKMLTDATEIRENIDRETRLIAAEKETAEAALAMATQNGQQRDQQALMNGNFGLFPQP